MTIFILQFLNTLVFINVRRGSFGLGFGTFVSSVSRDHFSGIGINLTDECAFCTGAFFLFVVVRFRVIDISYAGAFVELFDCELP